jgi:DNA-directed RNA polymerase subunit K/omega
MNPHSLVAEYNIRKETAHKVDDNKRMTRNFMSKYEYTNIISVRTEQISNGAPLKVTPPKEMTTVVEKVKYELEQGKTPLIIRRHLPNGTGDYEDWKVSELVLYSL